jgi:hypothetical protein
MNLLSDNVNTSTEENVGTEQEVTETNTEVSTNEETEQEAGFFDTFKEYMGEDFDPKYENTYKKFEKDGDLDKNEILKAYRNLEKSFSEKREAPESYEVEYSEDISEDYRFKDDSDLSVKFTETAKELNITNEQYSGIMNMMGKYVEETETANFEAQKAGIEEMKKSIPDLDNRVNGIKDFLGSVLDNEQIEAISSSITTEKGITALEEFMKLNRDPVIPRNNNDEESKGEGWKEQASELRKQRDLLPSHKRQAFHNQNITPLYDKNVK